MPVVGLLTMLQSVINQDGKNLNFLDLEKSMSIIQT